MPEIRRNRIIRQQYYNLPLFLFSKSFPIVVPPVSSAPLIRLSFFRTIFFPFPLWSRVSPFTTPSLRPQVHRKGRKGSTHGFKGLRAIIASSSTR